MSDQGVNYTVKEIVSQINAKMDDRHKQYVDGISRIETSVEDLAKKVDGLESDRAARQARSAFISKMGGFGVAIGGFLYRAFVPSSSGDGDGCGASIMPIRMPTHSAMMSSSRLRRSPDTVPLAIRSASSSALISVSSVGLDLRVICFFSLVN